MDVISWTITTVSHVSLLYCKYGLQGWNMIINKTAAANDDSQ